MNSLAPDPSKAPSFYDLARESVIKTQSASTATLQRRLKLGFKESEDLLKLLEGDLVSRRSADGHRTILPRLLDITHVSHPTNTYWVVPNILMAGEYPGTKYVESTRKKLECLLDAGVTAFLDLTEPSELRPYENELREIAQARQTHCSYRRMPIRDMRIPDTPRTTQAILNQIDQWIHARQTTYVHCWGGVGRTGTVVGCHLVHNGMDGSAALNQIRLLWTRMSADKQRRHPISPQTDDQCEYVRAWAGFEEIAVAQ